MKTIIFITLSALAALAAYAGESQTPEIDPVETVSSTPNDSEMNQRLNAFDDQLHARIVKNLTHPTKISIPGEQPEELVSESPEQPAPNTAELFAFNPAHESRTF